MREEEVYRRAVDVNYSYNFAKRMEQYKTNEKLGYRTAGSKTEAETGEMIRREMENINGCGGVVMADSKYDWSTGGGGR